MRAAIVAGIVASCACACSARPPAPQIVEPERSSDAGAGDVGPLIWLGLTNDRLQVEGEPLHPDGRPDYAFTVRLSGPVVSLTFTLSDTHGKRVGESVWDTISGNTPIPASLDLPERMKIGLHTANLAVYDHQGTLLNPNGSLPPNTTFDGDWCTLVLPDWGTEFSVEGRAFTLLVLRPDGRVDRTTVVIV
jgi:hypothetical protein